MQNEENSNKILDILEDYYSIIIDYVFKGKFDELLSCDLKKDSQFALISYDPSKTIYNELKKDINNEFNKNLNILKINENINKFLDESENNNTEIIKLINESNEILLNERFNELLNEHNNKIGKILDKIYDLLNKNNELIDKLKPANLIDEEDRYNLENYKDIYEKLKTYGLSEDNNEKISYYKLEYDIKEGKQYELFLDDSEIKKIDKKEGCLYIVTNDNLETLKNKLKINEIISEEKEEHEKEKIGFGKEDDNEDNKEEENKEMEDNKEDLNIKKQ